MSSKELIQIPRGILEKLFNGYKRDLDEYGERLQDVLKSEKRLKRFLVKAGLFEPFKTNEVYAKRREQKNKSKMLFDMYLGHQVYIKQLSEGQRAGALLKYIPYIVIGRPADRTRIRLKRISAEQVHDFKAEVVQTELPEGFVYQQGYGGFVSKADNDYYEECHNFDKRAGVDKNDPAAGTYVDNLEIGL